MKTNTKNFFRLLCLWMFLLIPLTKTLAQQTYIQSIKYTDVGFAVYFTRCDYTQVTYQVNGNPFPVTTIFASGGFIANRFPYGILKVGDVFTVTNTCDGTAVSTIVKDDFSYVEVPNGISFTGNGISATDSDPPYSRLQTPVQVGQCEVMKNINAHILDSYYFSMNDALTFGMFKHNGIPIVQSDYTDDHYGQNVSWHVNADGSVYTDNATKLTSIQLYSGAVPQIISYTHNGSTINSDLTIQFGGLAIRYIQNGSYSIEKNTAAGFQRTDYQGFFNNSTFEIRYNSSTIEAWIDGVKVDELVRDVQYVVSGGGILSNTAVLPYRTPVDFTPSTSGDYTLTAIVNGVRKVEQKFHVTSTPTLINAVTNANCSALGTVTANGNGGFGVLQYAINGGLYSGNNIFGNLSPGNYMISVKDASGCVFNSNANVTSTGQNPSLTLSNTTCSSDLKSYEVNFITDDLVTASAGTLSGNTITGIPAGINLVLTATSSAGCQTTLNVNAPNCTCPTVNAPISGGDQTSTCIGTTIPAVSVTVDAGETADWYDAPTGGNLLASATPSYQPTQAGTYYAQARNTTTNCVSATRTGVTVSQNALPSVSLVNTACSADLKSYEISFTTDGVVTASAGTVSGNTVTGIPTGTNVVLTVTSSANCQTTLNVNAPNCACPTVNAPISSGDQTSTCVGSAIPAVSVTVNTGETADWYDAPTGGNLLASTTNQYQPTQAGTYYAQTRNTTTNCLSATRTGVIVSQNALPSLSLVNRACSADLKSYSINFNSNATVTASMGKVSAGTVSEIPAGTNLVLTSTSLAGCQATLNVNSPNCACPNVNAPILAGDQTSTCVGTAIPSVSITVNADETADWYDAPIGGNLLASSTTSYQATQAGNYYAEARNITTNCVSASRTSVIVSQNALPSLTLSNMACSADLKSYEVHFTTDGVVKTSAGTVSGNTIMGVPVGTSLVLTATSLVGCQTTLNVDAPNCACPTVNAPISDGEQTSTCEGTVIPAVSVTVNAGETADWYDAPIGGNLLISNVNLYQPTRQGTYYAEARNIATNCISAYRTGVIVSQNALPSLSLTGTACSADLKTYRINFNFESDGVVIASAGTVSGNIVTDIPSGTNVVLTATSSVGCQTTLTVNAPNCACPTMNAPISGGDQTSTCEGTAIPVVSVTVNAGETADWYDAPRDGNLLVSANTSYQPTQGGVFYAEARNITTNCISANRTGVTINVNGLPSLSVSKPTCSLDNRTYSISFKSNGIVTASAGMVSSNSVIGIPTGTNIVLSANSSAGCQTIVDVNAPECRNCVLNVGADATNISQGQLTTLHASGCNGGNLVWENTGKVGSDITVQPVVSTTYKATCSFTSGIVQCAAEITITVSPCQLSATASSENITQGESVTLSASGCPNGYLIWEGTHSESSTITVTPYVNTTYTAKCWYSTGKTGGNESCSISKTITVTACQLSATVSSEYINQGESVVLSASGCKNGYLIWAETNSDSPTITVTPYVTTTYTAKCWYATGSGNESCSIAKTITVMPCQLSATASSENITQGESVTLSALGCKNGYLIWVGTNSDSPMVTVTPYVTTTYTAKCWYPNVDGSGNESCIISKTINVTPCQLSAKASSENITKGEIVTLSASGCKNGYLIWVGTHSESPSVSVKPLETTTYTAKCWYDTGNGNESCSISKTIYVSPCHLKTVVEKPSLTLGESFMMTSTGCIGTLTYPQDTTQNGKSNFTYLPDKSQDFTIQCKIDNIISCDTTIHISVTPCHLSVTAQKVSLTLGESLIITSTGCLGTLIYPQDTTQNGKSVFTYLPNKTQDFRIQCRIGNIMSCDTTIHIIVEPCHLSVIAEKASVVGGELLKITSTGCIGTLIYLQDTLQNGKSVFTYLPSKTQTYTIQCQIGNIISCDTNISIIVDKCPSVIKATSTTIIKGDYTTLSYEGCPNKVVWRDLGTGANKKVNPINTTIYYASCNYGDKLQYSCSNDSIIIRVRPKQPILDNNRLGTSGITLQDTICLNTDLLMLLNCEQGTTPFWNDKAINQLKADASQVGMQTYQFYCQNDDDGERSDISIANVLVKGFEIEDAIVYPNPTTGILRINSSGCLDNLHLVLYNLYGQVLYEGNGEYRASENISIDLTSLPSNEYVLHITGKQGLNEMVTKRVRVSKYSK